MKVLSIATVSLAGFSTCLSTQETGKAPVCSTFEVYLANGAIEVTDVGNNGFSIGDRLTIRYDIADADGNVIGTNLAASTFVEKNADDTFSLIGDVHHVYDNGTRHYSIVYELADPDSPARHSSMKAFEYPVLGGSGDFAGARGTATASTDASGRRVIAFDLSCED